MPPHFSLFSYLCQLWHVCAFAISILLPSFHLIIAAMVVEGDASHSKSIPSKHYEIGMDVAELQEKMRKLTKEVEQVKGSTQRNPY